MTIEQWPIDRLIPYARNPRRNDEAVERMVASIQEFGFKIPVLARSSGEVVDGHLRLKAARTLAIPDVPVILCDEWSEEQVKAFRLLVNRSVSWASWDEELLALEIQELKAKDYDLTLTGFDGREVDDLLAVGNEDAANATMPPPAEPVSQAGDLWLCGDHRVLCGDCTDRAAVDRLLGGHQPILMVTDPPYGIELDTEWRDRAGLNSAPGQKRSKTSKKLAKENPEHPAEPSYMRRSAVDSTKFRNGPRERYLGHDLAPTAEPAYMKHRTEGHTETSISGDTKADWSDAFELVPSLQVAYVWHASVHTVAVLQGLLRIGFLYPQQIIWVKGVAALTRTHYWYEHEPCWFVRRHGNCPWYGEETKDGGYRYEHEPLVYVRKKNAPWYGKPGECTTVWEAASPKMIMGGSDEQKYDHPTQKPVELMRRPILHHTKRGEVVYEPFLGLGTTLAAADMLERVCCGMELDPKFVDVVVQRWQTISEKKATLEGTGETFEEVSARRQAVSV